MYNICDLFFNVSELLCLYFLLLVHFAACNNHLKITLSVTFRSLTLIAFLNDFCDIMLVLNKSEDKTMYARLPSQQC